MCAWAPSCLHGRDERFEDRDRCRAGRFPTGHEDNDGFGAFEGTRVPAVHVVHDERATSGELKTKICAQLRMNDRGIIYSSLVAPGDDDDRAFGRSGRSEIILRFGKLRSTLEF